MLGSYEQIKRALVKVTTVEQAVQIAKEIFAVYLEAETFPGEGKDRRVIFF